MVIVAEPASLLGTLHIIFENCQLGFFFWTRRE